MAFAPIPEYEGKSPYVFITYAQQDERIAYSIAVKMYNEGFRLWSSAACGNPSNMRIAERLSNAEVAMVFLSKSYLKYASYREFEPRVVMSSPKQKIVICLDDTPIGTDWNTVDFPAGIRYNPDIPQELWLRINSSDTLEKCRGAWPKQPLPLPFQDKTAINVSVNEEELSDELRSLNSVMSSFGAGLDDKEAGSITLFQRHDDERRFEWRDKQEPSQEQEYYAIENLIDTSPMPSAEKKQYDNMIGLIENFMQRSHDAKSQEENDRLSAIALQPSKPTAATPPPGAEEYRPLPLKDFYSADLSKDVSASPVMLTHSAPQTADQGPAPIVIDYGEETETPAYNMTRGRSDRFAHTVYYPGDDAPAEPAESKPAPEPPPQKTVLPPKPPKKKKPEAPEPIAETGEFEKIVDDRILMTSTEETASDARLTFHLGGAFSGLDMNDFADDEPAAEPPKPEPKSEFEPVDHTPVRFQDDDIPLPTLSFAKPKQSEPLPEPPKPAPKPAPSRQPKRPVRKRCIVSVRTRVRHVEYESEMYEVNGRWIPAALYHKLMPNAKYTAIRRIKKTTQAEQPEPAPTVYHTTRQSLLHADSRLHNAVSTFFTPSPKPQPPVRQAAEQIPEPIRSALRERHEVRRSDAIRQAEEQQAALTQSAQDAKKSAQTTEDDNSPARKHKFSHEGGIKKSLMANMETPVNTAAEETHRQYGARAEMAAAEEPKKNSKKSSKKETAPARSETPVPESKKNKKKKSDKPEKAPKKEKEKKKTPAPPPKPLLSYYPLMDIDDDTIISLSDGNQPKIDYNPAAYRDMNLSEILFGASADDKKSSKKKKKK